MVKYKKIEYKNAASDTGFRYLKDNKLTKESRIPHEVMEKFQFTPEVDYDDEPSRRRCLFCDSPQKRLRVLNLTMVDLCEWHYQHMTLGKVAEQVRKVEEEIAREAVKPTKKAKKKKLKKTALSEAIS